MGYLIKDHRQGQGVDGKQGKLEEYDTVHCRHCGAVIKIVIKGVMKAYETKFSCGTCHGPICRYCATVLNGEIYCRPVGKLYDMMLLADQPDRLRRLLTRVQG